MKILPPASKRKSIMHYMSCEGTHGIIGKLASSPLISTIAVILISPRGVGRNLCCMKDKMNIVVRLQSVVENPQRYSATHKPTALEVHILLFRHLFISDNC